MYVTVFESFEKENVNYKGQQFYYMDEEGLKLYATKGSTAPIVLGKSATELNSGSAFFDGRVSGRSSFLIKIVNCTI